MNPHVINALVALLLVALLVIVLIATGRIPGPGWLT